MTRSLLTFLFAGAISASMTFAGVSVTSQSRSVSIMGQVPGADPSSSFDQTADAAPDAPFNLSLQNAVGTGEVTASASAAQVSTLELLNGGLTFSANGSVVGSSSDANSLFNTSSQFSLTFIVDAPAPYLFNEQVSSEDEIDLGLLGADLVSGDQSLFGVAIPGLPRLEAADVPSFQTTGILSPGTYTLTGGAAGNGNLTAVDASYSVDFSVNSNTPASQVIPLPASGWSGAIGLALSIWAARRTCR